MKKEIGLYIHIPFCVRKCAYCDFSSFAGREADIPAYIKKVGEEAARRARGDFVVSTLYIGGGTPSVLPPDAMARLLQCVREHFSFTADAECSCECNPGTVTRGFLSALRSCGINRLSFGAQARQEGLLRLLGRIHDWEQVEESAALAREAGFCNINLDLMLGLPGQTLADVKETLDAALALHPTHLSCYGLILEDGTEMKDRVDRGEWTLPEEDQERDMYECCRETLSRHGFRQYEISNFALPGFFCRHNVDCWKRKEYVGLGCAACGFLGNVRYQNPPDLGDYLAGEAPRETVLSPEDAMFESVMLGLRMTEGVSEEAFFHMHGKRLMDVYGKKLQKHLDGGLVIRERGFVRLSRRGMDIQNSILVDLL